MKPTEKDQQIISLFNKGNKPQKIVEITGFGKSKVYEIIRRYKNNTRYEYHVQGRKKGEKTRIPESISDTLLNTTPTTGTWTVRKIYNLIMQEDIIVSDNTIKNFLKKYGLFLPFTEKKIAHSTLYVVFKPYSPKSQDNIFLCYAHNSQKKYHFLLYNYAQNGDYDRGVKKESSILYHFCSKCKSDTIYSYLQITVKNNINTKCLINDWNVLNKHYKYNLPEPVIKKE